MTNADVARGTVTVVLHIESSKERTGINGKLLVKNILAAVGDRIDAWEGYQTRELHHAAHHRETRHHAGNLFEDPPTRIQPPRPVSPIPSTRPSSWRAASDESGQPDSSPRDLRSAPFGVKRRGAASGIACPLLIP